MHAAQILVLSVAAFCSALWLTGRFRRYALARQLLDIPTERSSHTVPTPRGGGVGIVVTMLAALVALGVIDALRWPAVCALAGGAGGAALIGLADDRGHVQPRWRLAGHAAVAAWVVFWLAPLPPLPIGNYEISPGIFGYGLAGLWLVWVLNLTNFMDGIDGIAGVEAITVSLGGALACAIAAPGSAQWAAPMTLAAATLGFLVWNWPPAKIFMGDAGSGAVGLLLGAFSLQAAQVAPALFWSWLILLGAFVVDAMITLLRRAARGQKFYQAHKTHAYQHVARRLGAHRPVTLAVGAINVCWLLPIALLVARGSLDGLYGAVIAYTPLVATALWLRAGEPTPV